MLLDCVTSDPPDLFLTPLAHAQETCTRDLTTCSLQVDLHKKFARLPFFLVYVLFLIHFSHRIEPQLHNAPAGLGNGSFSPSQYTKYNEH